MLIRELIEENRKLRAECENLRQVLEKAFEKLSRLGCSKTDDVECVHSLDERECAECWKRML